MIQVRVKREKFAARNAPSQRLPNVAVDRPDPSSQSKESRLKALPILVLLPDFSKGEKHV